MLQKKRPSPILGLRPSVTVMFSRRRESYISCCAAESSRRTQALTSAQYLVTTDKESRGLRHVVTGTVHTSESRSVKLRSVP